MQARKYTRKIPAEKSQGAEKPLKAATIGVFHHECMTSLSTEKFPGITLEQLSPVVYLAKRPKTIDYSLMWDVEAETPSEINEYLKAVRKDKATERLRVLEKSPHHARILLRMKGPTSSYARVISGQVSQTSPVLARAGYEVYNLLAEDPKNIAKLLKELSELGDVKVMHAGDYRPRHEGPSITEKQAEALQVALINNYYSWPRGASLDDLAKVTKISRRSLQERLRRAEAKLLPYTLREFLKKRY